MGIDSRTYKVCHDFADVWIATIDQAGADYAYGGTRLLPPQTPTGQVYRMLHRLMLDESWLKNRLIDVALRHDIFRSKAERLPGGFQESSVSGARCIIIPNCQEIFSILSRPDHPDFRATVTPIFEFIGDLLNQQEGTIKLTPDFGRFSGLADILMTYTPHVLGICCEDGGCGGKASYSSTGVIAALEALEISRHKDSLVTLIGAAGAMGAGVLAYVLNEGFRNVAVCDIAYDDEHCNVVPPDGLIKLPARTRQFTDACLERGGVIVATTFGDELARSNWRIIPGGTILLLAHNLALPEGRAGIKLARELAAQDILVLPGQILTLGGALTSRLEWFWRQANPGQPFDKPLAHEMVRECVVFLVNEVRELATSSQMTPYEAMRQYALAGKPWVSL